MFFFNVWCSLQCVYCYLLLYTELFFVVFWHVMRVNVHYYVCGDLCARIVAAVVDAASSSLVPRTAS